MAEENEVILLSVYISPPIYLTEVNFESDISQPQIRATCDMQKPRPASDPHSIGVFRISSQTR